MPDLLGGVRGRLNAPGITLTNDRNPVNELTDSPPTVAMALVRLVLRGLGELGADKASLATNAGLPAWALHDDTVRVPEAQLLMLWQAARATLPITHLGLHVGDYWTRGSLFLSDYLFENAATLGDALGLVVWYQNLLNSSVNHLRLVAEGDLVELQYAAQTGDPEIDMIAGEFVLSVLIRRTRSAFGDLVQPARVTLAGPPSPSDRELVEAFGTRRIEFDAGYASLAFEHPDLGQPMPTADPMLAAALSAVADMIGPAAAGTAGWLEEFRALLVANLQHETPSLRAMGRQVAMSSRTLQRRLAAEGTSWRDELESVRRALTVRFMAQGMSRKQIAARLGFRDSSTLRRAMRRWNQQPTPTAVSLGVTGGKAARAI